MKKTLAFAITVFVAAGMVVPAFAKGSSSGRTSYGGGSHTSSHGGNYRSGSGSSHKGGTYQSPKGGKQYGTHK